MYDNFMSMETLATFAGLVTAVTLIVQFTKSLVKSTFKGDIYVRLYTLIIALGLSFVFARAGIGIEGTILTIINAVIISVAAMGTYEVVADPKAEKHK